MRALSWVLQYKKDDDRDALIKIVDTVSRVATAKEVDDFIDLISSKGRDIKRNPEIITIQQFIHRGAPLAFINMDRLLVGLQLVTRVLDHNRIQQKSHSTCGPVSLIHEFATRDPAGYVDYVTGLAENRRGYIGDHKVKVKRGSNILTKTVYRYGATIHIQEADYIALASLREHSSLLAYRSHMTNTMLQGCTSATQIKTWMEKMGFDKVSDHTLSRWWGVAAKGVDEEQKFKNHVDGLQKRLRKGRVIILCSAAKLTQHQLPTETVDSSFGATLLGTYLGGHWMLCRDVEYNTQGVRFALDSWGDSSELNGVGAAPLLPWSKVTSWYRGYVSGQP